MKKFFYTGLFVIAAVSLCGCSEENGGLLGDSTGGIALSVNLDSQLASSPDAGTVTSRASAKSIAPEDLTLRLTSADGSYSSTWSYSSFPTEQQFKVGEYTLEAFYGEEGEEGFEKPWYHESTTLKVYENQVTPVAMKVQIKNALVQVAYTDDFKKYFSNYSATITGAGSPVYFSPTETRPVYVTAGPVKVSTKMTTPQGKEVEMNADVFQAEARHLYTVTFGIDGTPGNLKLTISYDDSLEIEDVIINLDDLESSPAPTFNAEGFTPGTPLLLVEGMTPAAPVKLNLVAMAGFTSVELATESKSLIQQGWPAKVNLIAADAHDQSVLQALGLQVRGLFRNPDKMAVLDFTHVSEHIAYVESDPHTTFTITVTDRLNRQLEPVVISIETLKTVYDFGEFKPLYWNSSELTFTFNYNGANFTDDIKFYYKNTRGTYTPSEYKVTKLSDESYEVVATVPANESDVIIKGTYKDVTIGEKTISRMGDELAAVENSIYATHATVNILSSSRTSGDVKIYAINNSGAMTELKSASGESGFVVSGLKPGTEYHLLAATDGKLTKSATITTENAAQLPIEEFETWKTTSNGSNWSCEQINEGAIWGTNNPMTTSQGGDFGYTKCSGTVKSTTPHTGKSPILLRTIGWGSGNTAIGTSSLFGGSKMKYADAGLLHLGSSRTTRPSDHSGTQGSLSTDDLTTGYPFTTRPSALTFWYQYHAVNSSDKGYAEISVYDSQNNVIASGNINLDPQGEYTKANIPLNYAAGSAKAAKIYVKFLSTNTEQALARDWAWITPANVSSSAMHIGSQLYLDDIELTY
ncbi:MAG: DUF4493 domain-containing protein [Muribaculaceae bacterium]|nr:DUF4493 domain-containing protein [Muribaculaceae bacterium]